MSKVQQKADAQARCLEVVHALSHMHFIQGPHSLQFHQDTIINEKIGRVFSNHNPIIGHRHHMLLRDLDVCLPKLMQLIIALRL